MLRRTFLAFLNLAPLSFAAKWFPGSTIAAKGDLFRHKGWSITWTAYPDSTTSLGYWMGVPVSKAALKRKNSAALRVLVPLGNDKTKLIGLKRLDYLIASDWKPVAGVAMQASPFQKPQSPGTGFDIGALRHQIQSPERVLQADLHGLGSGFTAKATAERLDPDVEA